MKNLSNYGFTIGAIIAFLLLFSTPPLYAEDNYCLNFDGNDTGTIPDSPNWALGSEDFTFECWLKMHDLSRHQAIWEQIGAVTNPPYHSAFYLWYIADNRLSFNLSDNIGGSLGFSTPLNFLETEKWYHVAVVRSSGTLTMYINLEKIVTDVNPSFTYPDLPDIVTVGYTTYGAPCNLNGSIDELRIWDYARTPEQLDYWKNYALSGSEDGLLGYWNFDDPNNIMKDLSPYGNNGQIYGAQDILSDGPVNPVTPEPVVPEPASLLLFGMGGLASALIKRKRKV